MSPQERDAKFICDYFLNKLQGEKNNYNVLGAEVTELFGKQVVQLFVKKISHLHLVQFPKKYKAIEIRLVEKVPAVIEKPKLVLSSFGKPKDAKRPVKKINE
jgi:hypothetical protein